MITRILDTLGALVKEVKDESVMKEFDHLTYCYETQYRGPSDDVDLLTMANNIAYKALKHSPPPKLYETYKKAVKEHFGE